MTMSTGNVISLIGLVVAGIVGFFTLKSQTDSQISDLQNEIENLQAQAAQIATMSSSLADARAEVDNNISMLRDHVRLIATQFQELDQGLGKLREDVQPVIPLASRIDETLGGLDVPDPVPSEAVVAFALPDPGNPDTNPCPKGWDRYARANGRFIVGIGTHRGTVTALPAFGTGGERTHALTEAEMPTHNHAVYNHAGYTGGGASIPGAGGEDKKTLAHDSVTSRTGSSKPHNNMPPYIALYFCKKKAG